MEPRKLTELEMKDNGDRDLLELAKRLRREREEKRLGWLIISFYTVVNSSALYAYWQHAPKDQEGSPLLLYLTISLPICLVIMYYLLVGGDKFGNNDWQSFTLQITRVVGQAVSIAAIPALAITIFATWLLPIILLSHLLGKVGVPPSISVALCIPGFPLLVVLTSLAYKKFLDWINKN